MKTLTSTGRRHNEGVIRWNNILRNLVSRNAGPTILIDKNFSSTTALRFADLEGLPSNNTMGPVNATPLQDVKLNHDEGRKTRKILDDEGTNRTTRKNVQAGKSTPRSRKRKSLPETSESRR